MPAQTSSPAPVSWMPSEEEEEAEEGVLRLTFTFKETGLLEDLDFFLPPSALPVGSVHVKAQ